MHKVQARTGVGGVKNQNVSPCVYTNKITEMCGYN